MSKSPLITMSPPLMKIPSMRSRLESAAPSNVHGCQLSSRRSGRWRFAERRVSSWIPITSAAESYVCESPIVVLPPVGRAGRTPPPVTVVAGAGPAGWPPFRRSYGPAPIREQKP